MSCGFGAVALVFLIIKHDVDTHIEAENQELQAEVNLLAEEINEGQQGLVKTRNTLSALDQQFVQAQGLATRIIDDIQRTQGELELLTSSDSADINKLQEELKRLEQDKQRLAAENEKLGSDALRYSGDGDRQYLTGLKLGGERILILLDSSASMLDSSIVNIIRRRNMSDNVKRSSIKWRRALSTVSWLSAQLPADAHYQIYDFNTDVSPAIADTRGQWLRVEDRATLEQGLLNLRKLIPQKGTNLENTFASISEFHSLPDNIFLITDGLPTQGKKKTTRNTVSGPERLKLFHRSLDQLPAGIPVNVILAPMEGDPLAAAALWKLAQVTQGSFLSPSKDWP